MHNPESVFAELSSDAVHSASLYQTLQKRILTGHYPPGARLRESELQHEFGISNGPVRESLHLASADGLVERAPFRGVRVIDLTGAELLEVFEVRQILLSAAAELAARRAPPDIVLQAAEFKARFALDDHSDSDLVRLPGELSQWIFHIAGNQRLADSYRRPLLQSLIYIHTALRQQRSLRSLNERAIAIIDAIAARSPQAARAEVHALTMATLKALGLPPLDMLDERGSLE